jgi:predicted DNA-binding protein (MmcQ/YjbR family)
MPDELEARIRAVRTAIEAMPGCEARSMPHGVTLYKVMGKMFAILEVHKSKGVILKVDPVLMDLVKSRFAGVGRRSHLDPRFWLHIDFEGDVPTPEIEGLASGSYDLVRASLTRAQRAALASA